MLSPKGKKVGVMELSESIKQRAIEVARLMQQKQQSSSSFDLLDGEAGRESGKALISTSATDIPIILGTIELDGMTYYVGLPENGH